MINVLDRFKKIVSSNKQPIFISLACFCLGFTCLFFTDDSRELIYSGWGILISCFLGMFLLMLVYVATNLTLQKVLGLTNGEVDTEKHLITMSVTMISICITLLIACTLSNYEYTNGRMEVPYCTEEVGTEKLKEEKRKFLELLKQFSSENFEDMRDMYKQGATLPEKTAYYDAMKKLLMDRGYIVSEEEIYIMHREGIVALEEYYDEMRKLYDEVLNEMEKEEGE